ncbi:hypothetical protein FE257_006500 [Aspergillus nanangensis]|uniref:DUF7721 domain-containing protein n=1 Tax=Aspergillus nanangensis TaxID=2582783 RepID=A0AAD4GZ20_ASPNN|nr:hypothetical protein FE257_006500 [Aspergillus nanangensis]
MSVGDFIQNKISERLNRRDDDDDNDLNPAAQHAAAHANDDPSLFNTALSFLKERKSDYKNTDSYEIDEAEMVSSHQRVYGGDDTSADSRSLGAGAAMQALKMFSGGGGGDSSSGAGGDKNAFIGLAMAQAGKLWDQKNSQGAATEDKQGAVNKAAEMALKMYMKSNGGGSSGTGGVGGLMGGSGDVGGLMKLAAKFM